MGLEEEKGTLKWIESAGGPLILLPEELLPSWQGINPPSDGRAIEARFRWDPGRPATDYDRAVDVEALIGVIAVGTGEGLVLWGEPLRTSWWPYPQHPDEIGLLIRWVCAESENNALQALSIAPMSAFGKPDVSFFAGSGNLLLFDAATPGDRLLVNENEHLKILLHPGRYASRTAQQDHGTTRLILHRLQLIG